MKYPDPFTSEDPRWQPWEHPQPGDFAMADETPVTLKRWLRSQECADEVGQQPRAPIIERPILPDGVYLQPSSESGIWQLFVPASGWRYDVYRGSHPEMLQIASSLTDSTQENLN